LDERDKGKKICLLRMLWGMGFEPAFVFGLVMGDCNPSSNKFGLLRGIHVRVLSRQKYNHENRTHDQATTLVTAIGIGTHEVSIISVNWVLRQVCS